MAKQTGKSGFMSKVGDSLRKAHEAHRNDDTTYSNFSDLPPGVSGVAQLVDCKFVEIAAGKENAGEYMFYAAGVILDTSVLPAGCDKEAVVGQRTQISEPMFDTPTTKEGTARKRATLDDHVAWVYNELRKLGIDTNRMGFDAIEQTVAALKEAGPYFRFRTWASDPTPKYPNPRTNHQWEGAVDDYEPPDTGNGVADNTPPAAAPKSPPQKPAATTQAVPKAPAPQKPTPPSKPQKPAPAPKQPEPAPEAFNEFGGEDLDELAKSAGQGLESATKRLTELAIEAGKTEEEVENARTWPEVVGWIREAGDGGGEGGDETEIPWTPAVGDVYLYKAKGKPKGVEVEVTAVDEDARTVNIKTLSEPKAMYKNVPWDALETA